MAGSITSDEVANSRIAAGAQRVRLRGGAATLLLGGLIFLLGVSRPVVTEWAGEWDDVSARIAIARAQPGEFRFGFVTMGLGFVVMGLGAGLLLLGMAPLFVGRRAVIARATAVIAILGGLTVGLDRAIVALVDLDEAARSDGLAGVLGTLGLSVGFIACGVLTWRGPLPRWAGVLFAVAGLVAAPTIPAVFMFAAIGFGLVGVFHFRRPRDVAVG